MRVTKSFDPAATLTGYLDVGSAGPGSKILLYNLSVVNLLLNFQNGDTALLHAGEANYWTLDGSITTIEWSQYSVLATAQAAISQVTGTVYLKDEVITGTYPMSLTYQINVGNASTVTASSTSIANDGNPVGTQILEASITGDGSPAVKITNDGHMTIGNVNHHGQVSLDNGAITTDGAGNLAVAGSLTAAGATTLSGGAAITGNVSVTGTSTLSGAVTASGSGTGLTVNHNALISGNATVAGSTSLDGGNITTDGVGDMVVGGVLTASSTLHAGHLVLGTGGLLAISKFGPYLGNTPTNTFVHNLGMVPDIVIAVVQGSAGGPGALHQVKVDASSYTSTNFNAVADVNNVSFVGIALKF